MSDTQQAPQMLRRPRSRSFLIGAILLLLPFVLYWQVWWPDARLRQVFQYGDFVEQHYPMRVFVADEYRHGRLPLWDPYTFSGEPAVAMSLFAPYYPPGFWQVIFPKLPFEALEIEAIFHLGLAGLFTFLFVRRLTASDGAGLIAGLAFSLGGYLTSYPMLQLIILETAVWLPAGLWLLDIALERRSLPRMALAGAIFGFGVLAGHPQTFLYIAYLAAAYFVFRVAYLRLPIRFGILAGLILGGAALGISAAHWLPGLQMYRFSPRTGLDLRDAFERFPARRAVGAAAAQSRPMVAALRRPDPARAGRGWRGAVAPRRNVVLGRGRPRGAAAVFGRLRPALSALLSFRPRLRGLPRSGADRAAGELLAGGAGGIRIRGADEPETTDDRRPTTERPTTGRRRLPIPSPWFLVTALALLIFLDLYRANNGIILQPPPNPDGYFAKTPIVTHIQSASPPDWRTSSEGLLPGDGESGIVFQIRDIVGSGPLYLAAYDRFLAQVPEERWWRMLNVQHLITKRDLPHGALKLVRQDGDLRLYQVFQNATLPWIAHAFKLAPDQDAAIRATGDPALDPFQQVILETPPDPPPAPPAGQEQARAGDVRESARGGGCDPHRAGHPRIVRSCLSGLDGARQWKTADAAARLWAVARGCAARRPVARRVAVRAAHRVRGAGDQPADGRFGRGCDVA